MNNDNVKKHTSKVLDEMLNDVHTLDYEKTRNRMFIASKISDFINNVFGGKTKFADAIDKYPSEITKWTSGTQNFTIDALTEITWKLGKRLHHLFEDEKPTQEIVYKTETIIIVQTAPQPIPNENITRSELPLWKNLFNFQSQPDC